MSGPGDDMEMEKMAEDELSKLQRQFRVMEVDLGNVMSSSKPTLRVQRNIINSLTCDLDKIMMQLKLTKSTSNMLENERTRGRLLQLLKEHEKYSAEVKEHRTNISQLDFLLKQVQKEIKKLRAKGTGLEKTFDTLSNQTIVSQLENRLNTAMTKFNSVNSENYNMRLHIDRLLCDRQFFNNVWKSQVRRLMAGKAQILDLLEQAISTYDQREELCSKLEALKEKAALDYRRHCLEVRELQRQLEHSMRLEQFLRTKGTVRLTAADARAEAKKMEQQELEMRTYNNYVNILDAIKEYTGEHDVNKLIQEFTRREEENYALFNYINEVNTELKNLSDNVKSLKANIEEENAKHQAKLYKQQESVDSLRCTLEETRKSRQDLEGNYAKTQLVLDDLLQQIQSLANSSECDSLPLLKLLGQSLTINKTNARLFIKSLEKKIIEIVDIIKFEEVMGSESCKNNLKQLIVLLEKFEKEPKQIEGKRITSWFHIGEDIFLEFFNFGQSLDWKYLEVTKYEEVQKITSLIERNKGWIESFISLYPSFRINFDLVCSADSICKIRSGIDVLLKTLRNISQGFDKVLGDLNELGEIDEFDSCLKVWIETGHRPDFKAKPSKLNSDHWWWF